MQASAPQSDAWRLLLQAFNHYRSHFRDSAAICGLGPMQARVLLKLEPEDVVSMNELAEVFCCDRSNITGLAERLEKQGLIKREASPEDRRIKIVSLTPAGVRLRAKLKQQLHRPPQEVLELSQADQQKLAQIIQKILESASSR